MFTKKRKKRTEQLERKKRTITDRIGLDSVAFNTITNVND